MTEPIAWARENMSWPQGYCLQWVRNCFGVAARYYDAAEAWDQAERKHRTNKGRHCPRNVPVWWTGGSSGHGHVALSVGGGYCISTDAAGPGRNAKVRIDDLTTQWGLNFRGWSEDINGVRVYDSKPSKPAKGWERVKLSAIGPKQRNRDVEVVKRRLHAKFGDKYDLDMDEFKDYWGEHMTEAYQAWQERLGFTGKDADGRPGAQSLRKLGLTVVD
jgi:hypothetical protein